MNDLDTGFHIWLRPVVRNWPRYSAQPKRPFFQYKRIKNPEQQQYVLGNFDIQSNQRHPIIEPRKKNILGIRVSKSEIHKSQPTKENIEENVKTNETKNR